MDNIKEILIKIFSFLKKPIFTEKTIYLLDKNKYSILIDKKLTKKHIKFLIEHIFNIKVLSINTVNYKNPHSKKISYKKAYITLKKGDILNSFYEY